MALQICRAVCRGGHVAIMGNAGKSRHDPVRIYIRHSEISWRHPNLGIVDKGTLPGSFTVLPRRDPAIGELHALCYEATDLKRVR